MKAITKSALLVAFTLLSALVSAQDIIITTDAKKIEAKILEVSKTEIRYKEFDNLDGPTFVLSTKDIESIAYTSGKVTLFKHTPSSNDGEIISKIDDYYCMGNIKMTEEEYLYFIRQNCPAAWSSYWKGRQLWANGWCMFGLGLGAALGIGVPMTVAGNINAYNSGNFGLYAAGITFIAVGSLTTTACIPCLIVGGIKKNNSHEIYNEVCATKNRAALELDFQAGQNGLGLALKF